MSVAGQDYILGFFDINGKRNEFFCRYDEELFKHLTNDVLMFYVGSCVKDVRKITFYEGEPKDE